MPSKALLTVLRPEAFTHEMFLRLIQERANRTRDLFTNFTAWSLKKHGLFWAPQDGVHAQPYPALSSIAFVYDGTLLTDRNDIRTDVRGVFGPLDQSWPNDTSKPPVKPNRMHWCLTTDGDWLNIRISVRDDNWHYGVAEREARIEITTSTLAELAQTPEQAVAVWERLAWFVRLIKDRAAHRFDEAESVDDAIHEDTDLVRQLIDLSNYNKQSM